MSSYKKSLEAAVYGREPLNMAALVAAKKEESTAAEAAAVEAALVAEVEADLEAERLRQAKEFEAAATRARELVAEMDEATALADKPRAALAAARAELAAVQAAVNKSWVELVEVARTLPAVTVEPGVTGVNNAGLPVIDGRVITAPRVA